LGSEHQPAQSEGILESHIAAHNRQFLAQGFALICPWKYDHLMMFVVDRHIR
jgi:hypothetical protein